jgi:hypothetical protein
MAGYFSVDRDTIKIILDWELGSRKCTLRRATLSLSAEEKLRRVTESQSLLAIRANLAEKNFQGIITEFWRNSQSDSGNIKSLHFRRFPKSSSRGWRD